MTVLETAMLPHVKGRNFKYLVVLEIVNTCNKLGLSFIIRAPTKNNR